MNKLFASLAAITLAVIILGLTHDGALVLGQRGGGRGIGGGGGRVGGGGGIGGGGISRPGGGISAPGGGGISRPSGGISPGGGFNSSPSFSAPKISQPIANRPNFQPGGGGLGARDLPGVVQGPVIGPGRNPAVGIGQGPGLGQKIGGGKGVIDPGFGVRPGFDAKSGLGKVDPKFGVRPGQPSTLPGFGLGGAGFEGGNRLANQDVLGRRQENIKNRQENLSQRAENIQDRMQLRQDFWKHSPEDRQEFLNNRREDWQNWAQDYYRHHDRWNHGYWNCGDWWQDMWQNHTAAMLIGTTMWGINRMNYWYGTNVYYNPYYVEPIQVGDTYLDYSSPLAVPPVDGGTGDLPPGVTEAGMQAFAEAQAAFNAGNYEAALQAVNKALALMPPDAIMHEFRALVLFALGNYPDAAATLNPVLAVTPGWDWTTMSGLYAKNSTYEAQLRKLENYVFDNPESAAARFLLAYHYLSLGREDSAAMHLRRVQKLAPKDAVSAQLLELLDSRDDVPVEPKGAANTAKIDMDGLLGTWSATRGNASFEMTLGKDKGFTWAYREGKKTQEAKGAYTIDGTTLAFEPDAGGVMVAEITAPQGGAMTFRVVGAPMNDPGLSFQRK
jgi:tetratricopeptide (TPR) repeat protein